MKPRSNNLETKIFRPSSGKYARLIFIPGILGIAFYILKTYHRNASNNEDYAFLIITLIALLLYEAWGLNNFYACKDSLLIKKNFFTIKHTVAWDNIKSMSIKRVNLGQSTYRILVIRVYSGPKKVFKFPVSTASKQTFIKLMKEKNISIKDYS
ncbi:hypothetical protein BKI52_00815 [marine bacterium AO1-C]|nr:hypothetical protein BKI52_00815 [marine bacterium AO1-C]